MTTTEAKQEINKIVDFESCAWEWVDGKHLKEKGVTIWKVRLLAVADKTWALVRRAEFKNACPFAVEVKFLKITIAG